MFEHAGVRGELCRIAANMARNFVLSRVPQGSTENLGGTLGSNIAQCQSQVQWHYDYANSRRWTGTLTGCRVRCGITFCATAKLAPDAVIADDATFTELVHSHGHGRFVITLDPNDKLPGQQTYQGSRSLDGESVCNHHRKLHDAFRTTRHQTLAGRRWPSRARMLLQNYRNTAARKPTLKTKPKL